MAYAQDADDDRKAAEIIVTGTRESTSTTATRMPVEIRQIPLSVSTLSSELLRQTNARRVEDLAYYAAGVSVRANVQRSSFTIRGFDIDASTLTDGKRRGVMNFYNYDMSLYDNVEILKGFSSVLYGSGPPGGSVNFVTRKPQMEFAGFIDGSFARDDFYRGTLDVTGAIIDDTLAARLIVTGQKSDFYTPTIFDDRLIIAPSLLWKPSPTTEILIQGEHNDWRALDQINAIAYQDRIVAYDFWDPRAQNIGITDSIRGSVKQQLGSDWTLTLDGEYTKLDLRRTQIGFFVDETAETSAGFAYLDDSPQKGISLRGEFGGNTNLLGMQHKIVAGVEYYRSVYDQTYFYEEGFDVGPALTPNYGFALPAETPLAFPYRGVSKETGFYFLDHVDLTDTFHLLAGVRYSMFKSVDDGTVSNDKSAFSPTLGATFDLLPSLSVYASYSSSMNPNGGRSVTGGFFPPTRGKQYEAGIKGDGFGRKLNYTLAAYQLSQDGILQTDPDNPNFSIPLGEITIKGVEFEANVNPVPALNLAFAASYYDAKITKNDQGLVGNTPANTPEFSGSVRANLHATDAVRVGGGLIYVGKRQGDNDNSFAMPSYTRFDIDGDWDILPKVRLSASVENLFNKDYYVAAVYRSQVQIGRPRTLTARVRYTF